MSFGWNDQDPGGQAYDSPADEWVGRVMSEEYNLAVQRNNVPQAQNVLGRMIGFWLQNRAAR